MHRRLFTFSLIALLSIPCLASAAFPGPQGLVNDFASILSSDTKGKIESMLSSFERASGVEVAVVTLPSLDGEPVENAAVKLFQEWGIGKKGKDNGVLFLVAPNDRRMRIEVGYGLEGAINDALAGRILDEAVVPRFRAGDMDAGVAAGSIAIVDEIARKEGIEFDATAAYGSGAPAIHSSAGERKSTPFEIAIKIIVFIIMIIIFIRHPWLFLFLLSSSGRGGGGGFGGGFGGFGGGLSGGGGASRGW